MAMALETPVFLACRCALCRFREGGRRAEGGFRIVNFNARNSLASLGIVGAHSGVGGAMERLLAPPRVSCLSFICVGVVVVRVIIMQVVCPNLQHVTALIERAREGTRFGCSQSQCVTVSRIVHAWKAGCLVMLICYVHARMRTCFSLVLMGGDI